MSLHQQMANRSDLIAYYKRDLYQQFIKQLFSDPIDHEEIEEWETWTEEHIKGLWEQHLDFCGNTDEEIEERWRYWKFECSEEEKWGDQSQLT